MVVVRFNSALLSLKAAKKHCYSVLQKWLRLEIRSRIRDRSRQRAKVMART